MDMKHVVDLYKRWLADPGQVDKETGLAFEEIKRETMKKLHVYQAEKTTYGTE